ncbi:Transcription factor lepE [Fusarium oxysporum f. sp. albedinis]|nr:Transcription factor lepE [Fusarium oxysporum f. sp. albedinis]
MREKDSLDEIWFESRTQGFIFLISSELPPRATWGMTYKSIIILLSLFTTWLRQRLKAQGVVFKPMTVQSLDDLKDFGIEDRTASDSQRQTSQEHGGTRTEKVIVHRQKVVYAYRQKAGRFTHKFGMARAASELVVEYVYVIRRSSYL